MRKHFASGHDTSQDIVKLFYDLETTGTNPNRNGIHQISGIIEVNGEVAEEFNFRVKPNPKAEIEDAALAVSNTTREDLETFPDMGEIHKKILHILDHYCDRYNAKDKIYLVGFNNRSFDDIFYRKFFEQNQDAFFGAWFFSDSLDVLVLASQYLIDRRSEMPSFKLKRVAMELGIDVDPEKLHDALYDVHLTRAIYRIVTGIEIEL